MADDIVTRLRLRAAHANDDYLSYAAADEIEQLRSELDLIRLAKVQNAGVYEAALAKRKDEVEHVRVALLLAVEELFTHRQYEAWTHEMLFNQFLEEARRG